MLAPIYLDIPFGEGKAAAGLHVSAFPGLSGTRVLQVWMQFSGWYVGWMVAWERGGIFLKCVEYAPLQSFRNNEYSYSLI